MTQYSVAAESLHELGREGVLRVRRWLDATARFSMSQTAYDFDPDGMPYTQVRVEQLGGGYKTFDLVGDMRDAQGKKGNTVYVECKAYTAARSQAALYNEHLATCYSAFAARRANHGQVPSIEFMWVTTHPFAVTNFAKLTDEATIASACAIKKCKKRLGSEEYDPKLGSVLSRRLWLVVVNNRMLSEMLMGKDLRAAVQAKIIQMELD